MTEHPANDQTSDDPVLGHRVFDWPDPTDDELQEIADRYGIDLADDDR